MTELILQALFETVFMIFVSLLIGLIFGMPLAIILFNSSDQGLYKCKILYNGVEFLINATRSIPYMILIILLIPLSRLITGSAIGVYAAIIPLGLSAILLVAKIVEDNLKALPRELIDLGKAIGASNSQIIWRILIPEALPNIISGITLLMINLVGYSTMAGAVGGGGLGDLAIRYGYQRYDIKMLIIIVTILIILVQILQSTGNFIVKKTRK